MHYQHSGPTSGGHSHTRFVDNVYFGAEANFSVILDNLSQKIYLKCKSLQDSFKF